MKKKRVRIGKIDIDRISSQRVMNKIQHFVEKKESALIVTPYSEMVVLAESNQDFTKAINSSDLSLPDGVGILWADMFLREKISLLRSLMRIINRHINLYQTFPEQIRGSEMISRVLNYADSEKLRVYFLGGSEEVIGLLKDFLPEKYPDLVLSGYYDKKITEKTNLNEIFQDISDNYIDLVIISLPPPFQELLGEELREYLRKKNSPGVIMCLGGSLDVLVGYKKPAPKMFKLFGLEWLWRFAIQPSRIRRIYRALIEFPKLMINYKYKPNN